MVTADTIIPPGLTGNTETRSRKIKARVDRNVEVDGLRRDARWSGYFI
jgi:hypothetical protein